MQSNNVTNRVACQWYLACMLAKSGSLDLTAHRKYSVQFSSFGLWFLCGICRAGVNCALVCSSNIVFILTPVICRISLALSL